MLKLIAIFILVPCALALYDPTQLPDYPVYYNAYNQQCNIPVKCDSDTRCPDVNDFKDLEEWAQDEACFKFETYSEYQQKSCSLIEECEYDYNLFFTKALSDEQEFGVKNTMTTDILLRQLASKGKCKVRNLLEGRCANFSRSLSLDECHRNLVHRCDTTYPYRSYDGHCNNLKNTNWGQAGNPFKSEIATCFDDYVSKRRLSSTGRCLPNPRGIIYDFQEIYKDFKPDEGNLFNMFGLVFLEHVNNDIVGRTHKRVRNATAGFRGCHADGSGVCDSRSPLTCPLTVPCNDSYYGPLHVECLNFSPVENSNDHCSVRYPLKRNTESSYVDLSIVYGDGNYDKNGKLFTSYCESSTAIDPNHVISVQFLAISGLFSQLHNYCVDNMRACGKYQTQEEIVEKCRSLTIAVYQRILYEEVLPVLFGDMYPKCNFDCKYDANIESTVSLAYVNTAGRFPHIWLPDNLTLVQGDTRVRKPFNTFFRNFGAYDCTSVLKGLLEDPIHTGTLADIVINTFFSKDNKMGHCLMCLDLERGRDAGLCPMLVYKHYFDKVAGRTPKCYNTFDDLSDTFGSDAIGVFKKHYESPQDLDALMLLFELFEADTTSLLPATVATATCLQYKRLKAGDRFFYTWNEFLTPALKELIKSLDMKTLLALFGGMDKVPVDPWHFESDKVTAKSLKDKFNPKAKLFCSC
ncbi:peroxidase skpo-1-like [Armigeres subalbatus]|uniref:peroxidase skpo-1-like n=1 Tax=Armigeres subalbatus TaxID=124917 RepID=UPI002ED5754A